MFRFICHTSPCVHSLTNIPDSIVTYPMDMNILRIQHIDTFGGNMNRKLVLNMISRPNNMVYPRIVVPMVIGNTIKKYMKHIITHRTPIADVTDVTMPHVRLKLLDSAGRFLLLSSDIELLTLSNVLASSLAFLVTNSFQHDEHCDMQLSGILSDTDSVSDDIPAFVVDIVLLSL